MKNKIYLILALLLMITATLHAEVPQLLNYQGKLMQSNGTLVSDGTYSIQFAIYDVPTGGTALWSETNASVQVKSGLFSALLGSQINIPTILFSGASRFLAIKVGTNAEMLPRQQITSVGYAFKSASADTVSDGAITASKIANGAITSAKLAASSITVNQLSPGIALPPGGIIMWTGQPDNIPAGWALCDGTSGTPDLRDRFIVGAGSSYAVSDTGGEVVHTLTIAEMPSHNHNPPGVYENLFCVADASLYQFDDPNSGTRLGGKYPQNTGGDQPHENRPPYYALCYIMKLGY